MSTLQSVVTILKKFGLLGGPTVLVWLQFGLPILVLIVGFIVGRAKLKKKDQGGTAKAVASKASKPAQPQYHLRKAWRRFLKRLPAVFRRSILSFDQFTVLGAAGSGKSWLVDAYTDWRRQTRQFAGGEVYDPELQVYLTSSSVIMEVPARVLDDHGETCRKALTSLWRSVYRRREPTIVVTIDVDRLRDSADQLVEYAEALRAKINVLTAIRKRPVEVRLALTRLDQLEGYTAFAEFCRAQGVATRLSFESPASNPEAELTRWIEEMRGHLSRALTVTPSVEFREIVTFLRHLPDFVSPLAIFVESLFASDPLSRTPTCGGVFLAMSPAGRDSPLERNVQAEGAPDPRRRHWVLATVGASIALGYLVLAFRAQWTLWDEATSAWQSYQPATTARKEEREARKAITRFGFEESGFIYRTPNFFGAAATSMRSKFSERLRDQLLVPRLKEVAGRGRTEGQTLSLPRRRSVHVIAVIHSDRNDRFKLLSPDRLAAVASMTGLEADLIADYVKSTDRAYDQPVGFDIATSDVEGRDHAAYWLAYFNEIEEVVAAGVIGPTQLRSLQDRAGDLIGALERFEHDELTVDLYKLLESNGDSSESRVSLRDAYGAKLSPLLRGLEADRLFAQRDQIRRILTVVRGGEIGEAEVPLLKTLLDRLSLLYRVRGGADGEPTIALAIQDERIAFDPNRWSSVIRDSSASELIARFVRVRAGEGSIFFTPEPAEQLPTVVWNPTNDGTSLFVGKGVIEGRYTRAAFEAHVEKPILRLSEVLNSATIPKEQRRELEEHVREHVRRYAAEYRGQLQRFFRSYSLNAPSQEALRVILAQLVSDQSPLHDFLTAFAENAQIEVKDPLLEPMRIELAEFVPLHGVAGEAGAKELPKYKAIMGQLLADLGKGGDADPQALDPLASRADSLEAALSPAGRIELANLRGEPGSYTALLDEWLSSIGLSGDQRRPFLAPLEQLARIGRKDIEQVVARVWERDMKPELVRLGGRFPFDPEAADEVTPRDLSSVLHPQSGKVFDLFRRHIEPIAELGEGGPFRERRSLRGRLNIPSDLFPMMNRAAALSARFWNANGEPIPLKLRIATVPFEHGPNPSAALTLIYLNAGEASVFNFNQKPSVMTVNLDWTKEQASQVGVQLTNLETKENIFPEPVVVEGSFWSLLRLLKKAEVGMVKQPANARLYSWPIRHRRGGTEKTVARFVLLDDPWEGLGSRSDSVPEMTLGAVN